MEGYLKKWINLLYRWQNRYFILHEDVLIYCLEKDKSIKGQVHLSICSFRLVLSDPLRIVINYGMSEMHLKASSVQERQKWYEALTLVKEKYAENNKGLLLKQVTNQQFPLLEGIPNLDLDSIHTSLTKIWVCEAQLQEKVSLLKGQTRSQIQEIAAELKNLITLLAQSVDLEYKKLVKIQERLVEKVREVNDINPPDNQEDLDEEQLEFINQTIYQSLGDEDEFLSLRELQEQQDFQLRKKSKKQELTNNMKMSHSRQISFVPDGSKSIAEILETIKVNQPIKYKNIFNNDAFKDMNLGIEEHRTILPCFKDPNEKVRIISVIKDMVGKDLTKITLPVTLNEPLSMLQTFCENLEYAYLLDTANQQSDSTFRMAYVMAFAVSSCCSTIGRVKKPFNPILGETFEYQCAEFKYISEQVSHHPPISAAHAESPNFEFWGNSNVITKFWGKSLDITPQGYLYVKLKKYGDHFHYQKPKCSIRNLIIGQQYLENFGEINFMNRKTGDTGQLILSERGWTGSGAYQLTGWVKDTKGQQKYTLEGKWDSQVKAINCQTKQSTVLWNSNPLPPQTEQQYFFTSFTIDLNHLNQNLLRKIAPTDSRIRPDQRALENGNTEVAIIEKARVEQKQRERRKELHNQNNEHQPQWFVEQMDTLTNEKCFVTNGRYWECRESGELHQISLDIY